MSPLEFTEVSTSRRSGQWAALSVVPLMAVLVATAFTLLTAVALPPSSSPAENGAISAVLIFWFVAVAVMALCAAADRVVGGSGRRLLVLSVAATCGFVGWWVARRFDTAWLDACDFGTGSGDRCIGADGSAPAWVLLAWPAVGVLVAGLCATVLGNSRGEPVRS